ncbi:MAG: 3'(2'),5'-bisphosphate nucleotidase CysQ [Pseudomonadota bacterium]
MLTDINIDNIIDIAQQAGKLILDVYQQQTIDVVEKEDHSPLTKADRLSHQYIVQALSALYPHIPIISEEMDQQTAFAERSHYDLFWLIDPLDGTKEFIKHNDEFTVNIALIQQSTPVLGVVYAPAMQLLYYAKKNQGAFVVRDSKTKTISNENNKNLKAKKTLRVVVSRSHLSPATQSYLQTLSDQGHQIELIKKGSSLKICLVAEGKADIYPRLGPTMEWDTAAAQAIVEVAGKTITQFDTNKPLIYNKPDLHNPSFIVC